MQRLKDVMEELLKPTDTPEDLLERLCVLDKPGMGKIELMRFKNFIMNNGEEW